MQEKNRWKKKRKEKTVGERKKKIEENEKEVNDIILFEMTSSS